MAFEVLFCAFFAVDSFKVKYLRCLQSVDVCAYDIELNAEVSVTNMSHRCLLKD